MPHIDQGAAHVSDPDWTMFVYPREGAPEAVFLMRGHRVHFQFFEREVPAWFDAERFASMAALEAFLAAECSYVPRVFRAVLWGTESFEDFESRVLHPQH